jgi:crotonobetainyl-CoA:carnitine CoA-transferase CaiB-like acyl-CoA transferase
MKPLSGHRVVDLTQNVAGPYCTQILADRGAEVIKVERPPFGDTCRFVNEPRLGNDSAYFMGINRGKKSMVIDLDKPEGREILYGLVAEADVFIENNRPQTNKKIGIDYESLKAHNPRIIAASVSGYGHTGPESAEVGLDLSIQARSGLMSLTGTGEVGEPPLRLGLPMGDLGGGIWAAIGILAALHRREVTGEGAHVDISLFDGSVAFTSYMAANYLASGVNPPPVGSGHHSAVPYQAFEASDGWVVVAVFASLVSWEAFCKATDRPDLFEDARFKTNLGRVANKAELVGSISATMRERTVAEWLRRMKAERVPASPVNKLSDVFSDPQAIARDMVMTMEHPVHGPVRVVGNPVRFDDWSMGPTVEPAPMLGQHTTAVLDEVLGLGDEEVQLLVKQGIVQAARDEPADGDPGVITPG